MSKNKKFIILSAIILVVIIITGVVFYNVGKSSNQQKQTEELKTLYEEETPNEDSEKEVTDEEELNTESNLDEESNNSSNDNSDSKNKSKNKTETGITSSSNNSTNNSTTSTNSSNNNSSTSTSSNSSNTSTNALSSNNSTNNGTTSNNSSSNSQTTTTVQEYPNSVSLSIANVHLTVGSTSQLVLTTNPSVVKNNSGTWSSSDTSVATVDSNGKITAVSNGFCNITFTSANGKTATKHIGVYYTTLGTKTFDKVIYNSNNIQITANNFIYDMEATSSPFYFTVVNNSGETINVLVSTTKNYSFSNSGVIINGTSFKQNSMSSIWIITNLVNNTTKKGYISIYQDYFRTYNVRTINSMSFYLIFLDENNKYKYSSDLITLNF